MKNLLMVSGINFIGRAIHFQKGVPVNVDDDLADYFLTLTDRDGNPRFKEVAADALCFITGDPGSEVLALAQARKAAAGLQ